MVPAKTLKCVIEDRGVAAIRDSLLQFKQVRGRLISDADQIGRGRKLKSLSCLHGSSSSARARKRTTSAGARTQYRALVTHPHPTRTVVSLARAANAASSVPSSPM